MGTMTALPDGRDHRRFRLATNQNETIVADDADDDVEGHRLATNDNETVVEGATPTIDADDEDDVEGHMNKH
jgi:hypothetical protein